MTEGDWRRKEEDDGLKEERYGERWRE